MMEAVLNGDLKAVGSTARRQTAVAQTAGTLSLMYLEERQSILSFFARPCQTMI